MPKKSNVHIYILLHIRLRDTVSILKIYMQCAKNWKLIFITVIYHANHKFSINNVNLYTYSKNIKIVRNLLHM